MKPISMMAAKRISGGRRPAIPDHVSDDAQRDYLFMRKNPKGLHFERWRCDRGCGKWFHAARDTVTLEFKAFYGITELPPRDLWSRRPASGRFFSASQVHVMTGCPIVCPRLGRLIDRNQTCASPSMASR